MARRRVSRLEEEMVHNRFGLFRVVAAGAVITIAIYFVLALALESLFQRIGASLILQAIGVTLTVIVPVYGAAWWVFRRLRVRYERREARKAAIAFAASTPVALIMGLPLGPIVGRWAGILLGTHSRAVAFSAAVIEIVVMIALVTFVASSLALPVTRRSGKTHQTQ